MASNVDKLILTLLSRDILVQRLIWFKERCSVLELQLNYDIPIKEYLGLSAQSNNAKSKNVDNQQQLYDSAQLARALQALSITQQKLAGQLAYVDNVLSNTLESNESQDTNFDITSTRAAMAEYVKASQANVEMFHSKIQQIEISKNWLQKWIHHKKMERVCTEQRWEAKRLEVLERKECRMQALLEQQSRSESYDMRKIDAQIEAALEAIATLSQQQIECERDCKMTCENIN